MVRAKVACVSVDIECGQCGEPVPEPGCGSTFWALTELPGRQFEAVCTACGATNTVHLPARVAVPAHIMREFE
jgi:hypothetical protein